MKAQKVRMVSNATRTRFLISCIPYGTVCGISMADLVFPMPNAVLLGAMALGAIAFPLILWEDLKHQPWAR